MQGPGLRRRGEQTLNSEWAWIGKRGPQRGKKSLCQWWTARSPSLATHISFFSMCSLSDSLQKGWSIAAVAMETSSLQQYPPGFSGLYQTPVVQQMWRPGHLPRLDVSADVMAPHLQLAHSASKAEGDADSTWGYRGNLGVSFAKEMLIAGILEWGIMVPADKPLPQTPSSRPRAKGSQGRTLRAVVGEGTKGSHSLKKCAPHSRDAPPWAVFSLLSSSGYLTSS